MKVASELFPSMHKSYLQKVLKKPYIDTNC